MYDVYVRFCLYSARLEMPFVVEYLLADFYDSLSNSNTQRLQTTLKFIQIVMRKLLIRYSYKISPLQTINTPAEADSIRNVRSIATQLQKNDKWSENRHEQLLLAIT